MHVGVPACGQRHLKMMREARAQHADLAGAGDVDDLRLKALEHFADEGNVAQEGGIEAQVFLEREGEKAARQLEGPHAAVFSDGAGTVAGAHAQKGKIATAGEGLKLAAGVRDPVDLVEGVREVGDAGEGHESESAS